MLHLFDLDHIKIHGLTKYKDLKREVTLDGEETLSFLYPQHDEKYSDIREECYIRTKDNEYVIKEANIKDDWTEFVCKVNVEDLKGKAVDSFETIRETCVNSTNLALAGTGWAIGFCDVTKRRTVRKNNVSSYDILQEIRKVYRCDFRFDAIDKKVYIYQSMGEDKDVYFTDKLNLKKLEVQSKSYDYCTRLIPVGKDGLRIGAINNGKDYVENYQYSNKIITAFWEDNRYTVVEHLKEDAIARLEELSKPRRAYKADIIDLAKASEKYKDILDYGLGDTITLLSKDKRVKEKQRIVKFIEYPDEPEKNTCEIANRVASLEDMQVEFIETTDTVDNITTTDGMVDSSKVDFEPIRLEVEDMVSKKADITDLSAAFARIGSLEVTKADVTELDTERTRINDLYATKATVEQLETTNSRIVTLEGKTADIEHILAGNITAEHIAVGAITAGSGIIADGAVGDAQISSLSASKLTAGKIDTSLVTVTGKDGKLNISGNRLQVIDNGLERVAIGDVNRDGTVYGLRVRGEDGHTVLFDEKGLTKEGLTDGAVDDSKVSANANIAGSKLDIDSVVREINDSSIETIKGTRVQVGDRTLDIELSTQKSLIDENATNINNQQSQITALDSAIKLKVDTQKFEQSVETINSSIEGAKSEAINIASEDATCKADNALEEAKEYAEKAIYKSDIAPTNKEVDDLWLDTSITPHVLKRWNGSGWVKATPTIANEVGAETPEGAQSKANAALSNARAYAETKASEAENAAKKYAETKAEAERLIAEAYADGKVTEEEQARINDVKARLQEAKAHAETKANEAESAAKTYAEVKANEAKENANQYTDGQITTVNTKLTKATSDISVLQDEIALKVEQTDIDKAVNEIEVGGRNLLRNSAFANNAEGWSIRDSSHVMITDEHTVNGNPSAKIEVSGETSNKYYNITRDVDLDLLNEGEEYTYSLWVMTPDKESIDGTEIGLVMYKSGEQTDWNNQNFKSRLENNKWIKVEKTFIVRKGLTRASFRMNLTRNGIIYYSSPKLEKGTKATDWTPAPEDFQHKIDKTNTRISTAESSITQLKDNIELKVDTSEYNDRMRLIDNNIERLETNVVTNSSNISVLQDEVATKVSQSDIDKITIGARNLLTDSQTDIGFYPNKKGSGQARLMLDSRVPYYKVTADTNVDLCIAFPDNRFLEPLNELGEITVSLEVKTDTDDTVTFENRQFDVKANTWTKIYVTKTFEENKTEIKRVLTPFNRKQYRYIDLATKLIEQLKISGNTLYYRNLQFEKGNKPTDWQPAPEEIKRELSYNSSEIKQTAERVDIRFQSGDFPLKGTNYSFDIDNFTIGGTGKDIVKHDNKRSVYLHEDGSYTEISAKGLYRYDAEIGREYHHITKIIKFTAGGDNVAPTTRWIPLGPEFNGKDWTVALSISDSTQASSAQAAIHRMVLTQSVTADGKTIQPRYRNGQWEFPVMGYKTNINVFEDTRRYGDIAGIMVVTA